MDELILFDLFNELRQDKQDVAPGLEEYYLFLRFLRSGYDVKTFDDLVFVIETMWSKSRGGRSRLREILRRRQDELRAFVSYLDEARQKPVTEIGITPVDERIDREIPSQIPDVISKKAEVIDQLKKESKTKENEDGSSDDGNDGQLKFSIGTEGGATGKNLAIRTDEDRKQTTLVPFIFTNDYFPVNGRDLRQAWRALKSPEERDWSDELDITATIMKTATEGMFTDFVFEKKVYNHLRLFVFIDRSESMVAVEEFGKELCKAAEESQMHSNIHSDGLLRTSRIGAARVKVKPWFFYNVPVLKKNGEYTLSGEDSKEIVSLSKVFSGMNKRNIVVLIYSDAGSLKNENDAVRVEKTKAFIDELCHRTAYVSWLNPAPRDRWIGTNAEEIQKVVPMFEATRGNIDNSIAALKGRLRPVD